MKSRSLLQGFVWNGIEMIGSQGVDFVTTLVLARLLTPASFGLIGMISVFFAVSQSLMDSGFKQALIQQKNPSKLQFDSVFWLNLTLGLFFYVLLFLSAPAIANFYEEAKLTHMIRWAGMIVPLNALQVVQTARMSRDLNFELQTKITIPAVLVSGVVAVAMAYMGYGVWSLVAKMVVFASMSSGLYWILGKYKPKLNYSWKALKPLFKFGYKLTLAGLLNTIFNNLYFAIIGKLFSAEMLGFYTQAKKVVDIPAQNAAALLQKVTFPYLARIQDQPVQLLKRFKIILHLAVFVSAPIMLMLANWSGEIVQILLGPKWAYSGELINIIAFTGLLFPIHVINLNVLKVMGRSDLFLKLELYKKGMIVFGIVIGSRFGIEGLLIAQLVVSLIALLFNTYYTNQFLGYTVMEQFKDALLYVGIAGLSVYGVYHLNIVSPLSVPWAFALGTAAICYVGLNFLLKTKAFSVVFNSIKAKRIVIDG